LAVLGNIKGLRAKKFGNLGFSEIVQPSILKSRIAEERLAVKILFAGRR